MKVKISKELLIAEYVKKNKSVPTLASELNVSCSAIYAKMKLFGIKCRKKWTLKDYTGQKFGNWLVLGKHKKLHSTWVCRCKCGTEKAVKSCNLISKTSTQCNNCKKTGCGEITGTRWSNIKNGAIQRKLEFSITVEEAWELFLRQNKSCALTGNPIWFAPRKKSNPTRSASNASLDRIDSTKGYTLNNVQWVLKKVNMMKQGLSQNEFIQLCKMVVEHESL